MTPETEIPLAAAAVPSPLAAVAPVATFGVGAVLATALQVWRRNWAPFGALSLAAGLPYALWQYVSEVLPEMPVRPGLQIVTLLGGFLYALEAGAVTRGTLEALRGRRARPGEMLDTGLARLRPVFGSQVLAVLGAGLAALLLVVPGVMLWTGWAVAQQAAAVEGLRSSAALGRSRELTHGHRWKVLGVAAVLLGSYVAVMLLADACLRIAAPAVIPAERLPLVSLATTLLLDGTLGAIPSVGFAVLYRDLRRAREGHDTDALATVFE